MLSSSDYIHSQPQLKKALGTAFPRQPLSKEAQELMNQLNKIKQQFGNKQQENYMQLVKSPPKSSNQITSSPKDLELYQQYSTNPPSECGESPYRDLQTLQEQPIFELQQSELPQPNLQKTLFYFPQSPIVEQMEEDVESPMQHKYISNRITSKFSLGCNQQSNQDITPQTEVSEIPSALNIYRVIQNEEVINEDLMQHHEDLKQLQFTLFQRIDQLNSALKKSLGQTRQNKENNKTKQNQIKAKKTYSTQVSSKKPSPYVKWSGSFCAPSETIKNSFSDDGTPSRTIKSKTKNTNTIQMNLKDEKKRTKRPIK